MPRYPYADPALLAAGALRHRVTVLERRTTVISGKPTHTWEPMFTCWASVEPIRGREYFEAAAVNRETEVRVTIRYRPDITSDMRLLIYGVAHEITSVINPGTRNVKLELLAKAINEGGVTP